MTIGLKSYYISHQWRHFENIWFCSQMKQGKKKQKMNDAQAPELNN